MFANDWSLKRATMLYGEIKGSLSSSWMNSQIPSLLLPLCAKLLVWKYVNCTFIRMKIKSFWCETFCTSTRSEKEADGNSDVEVKPACMSVCQAAHQASAYSSFCSMKHLEVFLLPPGLDASPSKRLPPAFNLPIPINTPEWTLRHCESVVSRPRTEYNVSSQGWNPDCLK